MRGRRLLAMILSCIAGVLPLPAIWMPIYGFRHAEEHFKNYPHGLSDYAGQLWLPFLQVGIGGLMFWFILRKKRPSWFFAAAVFVPGLLYLRTAGVVGHDFSHVILHECSERYLQLVWSYGASSATCAAAALLLQKQAYAAAKFLEATQ